MRDYETVPSLSFRQPSVCPNYHTAYGLAADFIDYPILAVDRNRYKSVEIQALIDRKPCLI